MWGLGVKVQNFAQIIAIYTNTVHTHKHSHPHTHTYLPRCVHSHCLAIMIVKSNTHFCKGTLTAEVKGHKSKVTITTTSTAPLYCGICTTDCADTNLGRQSRSQTKITHSAKKGQVTIGHTALTFEEHYYDDILRGKRVHGANCHHTLFPGVSN